MSGLLSEPSLVFTFAKIRASILKDTDDVAGWFLRGEKHSNSCRVLEADEQSEAMAVGPKVPSRPRHSKLDTPHWHHPVLGADGTRVGYIHGGSAVGLDGAKSLGVKFPRFDGPMSIYSTSGQVVAQARRLSRQPGHAPNPVTRLFSDRFHLSFDVDDEDLRRMTVGLTFLLHINRFHA